MTPFSKPPRGSPMVRAWKRPTARPPFRAPLDSGFPTEFYLAAMDETRLDSPAWLADVAVLKTRLSTDGKKRPYEGESTGEIATLALKAAMFTLRQNNEILRSVVCADAIHMVDSLAAQQWPTKNALSNDPMFGSPASVCLDPYIAYLHQIPRAYGGEPETTHRISSL